MKEANPKNKSCVAWKVDLSIKYKLYIKRQLG